MYTKREVIEMYNILVWDDDKEIVEAIDIYLSQEGYHILKAYDGVEALKEVQKEGRRIYFALRRKTKIQLKRNLSQK